MKSQRKAVLGVTLIEYILVIVIAASILMMGFRQYLVYRDEANISQVKANIDTLLNALALYYKANCYGSYNANTGRGNGTLNPNSDPAPSLTDPKVINIETDLISAGFLSTDLPTIFALNPIVDPEGSLGQYGYVTQFNPKTADRKVCTNSTATDCAPEVIGTIVIWKPQVSILLKDTDNKEQFLALLGGDCLSSPMADGGVRPCVHNAPGDYVVWERLPSLASTDSKSPFWQMNPTVQQFNQMYRTFPINYLIHTKGQTADDKQYFLCGG